MKTMKPNVRNNQAGMVAIIVTMIMMFVITLIVIGFSDVTRRNQREALDTQLGLQAYYAAETGVNDVLNSIKAGLTPSSTSCNQFNARNSTGAAVQLPRDLTTDATASSPASVANTCLLVDANPPKLVVDTVNPTTDGVVWDVKDANPSNFSSLTLSWQPPVAGAKACTTGLGFYPAVPAWNCEYALLRVDIVKAGTAVDAVTLANNMSTFFIQPSKNAGGTLNLAGALGSRMAYQTQCRVPAGGGPCTIRLNLGAAAANEYYVRLTSMYTAAKTVTLTGLDAGGTAKFANGQVVIDSTGRAQDQIKRIQVRVPLGQAASNLPVFAVQSTGTICKDITYSATLFHSGLCRTPSTAPAAPPPATGGGSSITGAFQQGGTDNSSDEGDGTGGPAPVCNGSCIYYTHHFTITKSPEADGATVNSCTWDWGDGNSSTFSGSRCDVGTVEVHKYDPSIKTCTPFIVSLVFHTNQGDIKAQASQTVTVPSGADSGC